MKHSGPIYQYIGAMVTAVIVTLVSAWVLWQKPELIEALVWQAAILVLIGFLSSPLATQRRPKPARYAFCLLLLLIFLLSCRVSIDLFFIYTIIWIAQAPYYLPRRWAWWSLPAVCVLWFLVRTFVYGDADSGLRTILEGTFHMFALITSLATLDAEQANHKTQRLNRELLAVQHLLSETSKDRERTRIARDLHDLLGHHLTALTINLQVASRTSEGKVKETVEQCHALAKLLLNDVRDAVSTLRDTPLLNLKELIDITIKDIPRLNVRLDVDNRLNVDEVEQAEAIIRLIQESITNTLKHSTANEAYIRVHSDDDYMNVSFSDNGQGCKDLLTGNGLSGMRERIQQLGGTLAIRPAPAFMIDARIPMRYSSRKLSNLENSI